MASKKATVKKMVDSYGKGGPGLPSQLTSSSPVPQSGGFIFSMPNARPGLSPLTGGGVPLQRDQAQVTSGPTYAGGSNPSKNLGKIKPNLASAGPGSVFRGVAPSGNSPALKKALQSAKASKPADFKNVMTPNQKTYGVGVGP